MKPYLLLPLFCAIPIFNVATALAACDFVVAKEAFLHLDREDRDARDQFMRAHERLIYLSKNRGTPISDSEMRAILQPLNERDAKNQERLDQLVSECGWPTYGKFGATPPYAASSVALHAPLPFKLKYLPMIEASFRRGEIPATRYAQYVDKVLSSQNKPQLYGYQLSLDRGGATTILPVEDPVHLNDRRQAIGLPPHPDFPMPTNWPGNSVERSPGMHNKTGATPK